MIIYRYRVLFLKAWKIFEVFYTNFGKMVGAEAGAGAAQKWTGSATLIIRMIYFSHAVGVAFAICLERKQQHEADCGVTMNYNKAD
jgi:hypothetical protein